jgi:hypothetical protein
VAETKSTPQALSIFIYISTENSTLTLDGGDELQLDNMSYASASLSSPLFDLQI